MEYNYDKIILDELVEILPELKEDYDKSKKEEKNSLDNLAAEDIQLLHKIQADNNLPETDMESPSAIMFLEFVATPYILRMVSDSSRSKQFSLLMNWLETKAGHSDFWVRNTIANGFCENIMTSNRKYFKDVFGYMGPNLKHICKMMLDQYHATDEMIDLLNHSPRSK